MTTGRMRFLPFLAVGVVAVLLAFASNAATRAHRTSHNPATASYEYKVEVVKHSKDLEAVLQEYARYGWHVQQVLATSYNPDLVVILERAGTAP